MCDNAFARFAENSKCHSMPQNPTQLRLTDTGRGSDFSKCRLILASRKTSGETKSIDGLKADHEIVLSPFVSISLSSEFQQMQTGCTYGRRCQYSDWPEHESMKLVGCFEDCSASRSKFIIIQ